jgi:RNA polymerase sigma factor (sigma-70 family)
MDNHQLILDNMGAIENGVRRAGSRCRLSEVDVQDLTADAVLKLLDGAVDSFDPDKGSASTFFRVVAWRATADALRRMGRGGQRGYIGGLGNTSLDTDASTYLQSKGLSPMSGARSMHRAPVGPVDQQTEQGRAVRVKGQAIDSGVEFTAGIADRQWTEQARAAVAAVLPGLTEQERELYGLMVSGDFDAGAYAAEHGVSASTAHVRANRLRAKLRAKLAA